jgi:hypothetical protein
MAPNTKKAFGSDNGRFLLWLAKTALREESGDGVKILKRGTMFE